MNIFQGIEHSKRFPNTTKVYYTTILDRIITPVITASTTPGYYTKHYLKSPWKPFEAKFTKVILTVSFITIIVFSLLVLGKSFIRRRISNFPGRGLGSVDSSGPWRGQSAKPGRKLSKGLLFIAFTFDKLGSRKKFENHIFRNKT